MKLAGLQTAGRIIYMCSENHCLRDVMPCCLVYICLLFEVNYCLHLQGRACRIKWSWVNFSLIYKKKYSSIRMSLTNNIKLLDVFKYYNYNTLEFATLKKEIADPSENTGNYLPECMASNPRRY
jgi:hypothetical protein